MRPLPTWYIRNKRSRNVPLSLYLLCRGQIWQHEQRQRPLQVLFVQAGHRVHRPAGTGGVQVSGLSAWPVRQRDKRQQQAAMRGLPPRSLLGRARLDEPRPVQQVPPRQVRYRARRRRYRCWLRELLGPKHVRPQRGARQRNCWLPRVSTRNVPKPAGPGFLQTRVMPDGQGRHVTTRLRQLLRRELHQHRWPDAVSPLPRGLCCTTIRG